MLALVAWGLGFFVWVGSVRAFALTRLALGALSLGGLAGVIALRGSARATRSAAGSTPPRPVGSAGS